MVFVFGSVYVVNYVYRLAYVEPALHPRDESYLTWWIIFLISCWIWFASILLRVVASTFIKDINLWFSFLVMSFPGLGIRVMLAS